MFTIRNLAKSAVCLCLASIAFSSVAFAAKGGVKGPRADKKPARPFKVNLILAAVPGLPADLAAMQAKFKFHSQKKSQKLRANVFLPVPAATLGVTDAATAQAAQFHMEFLREGVAYADCTAALDQPDPEETLTKANYKLFANKNKKVKFVKGACNPAAMPAFLKGDAVKVYTLAGGTRMDLLASPE